MRGPIAAILVALVANGAVSTDTCRTGCKSGDPQSSSYTVGTTYKYNYHGKIDISLSSAEGQSTSSEVKATVLLTQQPECNQVLRLQNVQIIGSNGKSVGSIPDIERPIRLNVHNGIIEDSICVEDGDNQNSINLKRAVASAFIANEKNLYETDIFGLCPTQIIVNNEGTTTTIQKRKNLNKCAYREHIRQDFLATAFNAESEIKSSPVLDSHYSSKQKISKGILESASIVEDYLYVPFSVGQNGARAQITTKLTLSGTSKDNPQVKTSQPRSIIFENPHPVVAPSNSVRNVVDALKNVAKTVDVVVGETTAKEFVKLLKIVRVSNKDTILSVFNQVQSGGGFADKEAAKRIFLDAILRAGTGESIEAAIALLKNNQLEEIDQKLVYLGLNLVRHATESSLVAAVDLLNQKKLPREAYLGVGNLAGRFCKQHSCKNNEAVHKLTQKLLTKLGSSSTKKREEENDTIFVLKALANFHLLEDEVVSKITTIAQDKKASNRLRVAALKTYLADPCKDKLRDSALKILEDSQQDSEIRITAYLAVARCPNAKIGNAVKALLEKEESIQVGGFIESHIRSLKASANPDKELAKQHLGFRLSNKFPIDPRKYSFNGEFSYTINTLGLAASTESDVIYSQESWLPRSTNLNLTAQIFGHTFNFLEVQTRQENLDRLVEHYFGPKGVLRSGSWKDIYQTSKKSGTSLWKTIEDKIKGELKRHRRDVSKGDLDQISKQIQVSTNALNKDLDLDLSVKAFGGEVLFLNINQEVQSLSPEQLVDKIVREFGKGLDQIKNFEKTLRSNLVFLDGEFSYPTSLGFPLRLGLEGTASLQLKTKGNVDVRSLYNKKDDGKLKLTLIPSANIEIGGRLTLDALIIENGLKVVSTLYSGVGTDLNIEWSDQGKNLDVKLGLPVKEQKLLSVNHEIVFQSREQTGKEATQFLKFAQNKDFSICLDQLSPIIGLTFCAELNGPNLAGKQVPILPFPLAGDAKLSVSIENDDVLEYHLKNKLQNEGRDISWELLIETIGKNKQSKAALNVVAQNNPDLLLRGVLSAPATKINIIGEAKATFNDKEKALSALYSQNGQEYSAKVGFVQSGSSNRVILKPVLECKTPQGPQALPIQAEGQIIYEKTGQDYKLTFDGLKIKTQGKTIALTGNGGLQQNAFFADLTASDGSQQASLKGKLQATQDLLKFNGEFQNSVNPNVNFNIKGDLTKTPDGFNSNLQLIHGKDLSSKTNILSFSSSLNKKVKSPQDFHVSTKNKFTYPLLGIDTKFEWDQTPKTLDYDVDIHYNDVKLGSELEAKINKKEVGDYDVEFELWGLDNKLKLEAKREIHGDESKIDHRLEVNDKKMEVKGKVRHSVRPQNVDVNTDLTVVLPTHNEPFKVGAGLKYNPNDLDTYTKITSGSQAVLDAFLKATKGGNANGSIKVNIKNILVVTGQLKANKGNGNSDIFLDFQAAKRQIKAESTFNVQFGELYNLQLTLYPVYDQDKNKKIVVSTNTKVSPTTIDSKNSIDILGNKLEVNAKGARTTDHKNHDINGEVEVTLPNERYLLAKSSCHQKENNNLLNGESQGLLEYRKNKNSPGKKISWKSTWKNTNVEEGKVDVEYNIAADDSNGQNINADVTYKQDKKVDQKVDFKGKLYGSLLQNPVETSFSSQCKEGKGKFDVKATNGPSSVLEVKGNYNSAEGKPTSADLNLNLQTPSKDLRLVQVAVAVSGDVHDDIQVPSTLQGSIQLLIDDDGTKPGPTLEFKSEGEAKSSPNAGTLTASVGVGKEPPIGVDLSYSQKNSGEKNKFSGRVGLTYGQGKVVKVSGDFEHAGETCKADIQVVTPAEGYRDTKLSITAKRSSDNKNLESSLQLVQDGKTWTGEAEIVNSEASNVVDLKLKCPEGKSARFYLKSAKITDKNFSGELKIVNEVKEFILEGSTDVNIESVEDFSIKANVNSPNLKIDKFILEAYNQPGKTDRKIQVIIKQAGKNLVSGSTTYNSREEHGKYIVEGSGSFKVKDETQSGNFKYISQKLQQDKNGENGIEISFDANLGQKAIDAEFKATNKHFRILNSLCEQKKECAHIEVDSKVNTNDVNNYNQVLEVNVDLRKLGLTHEFGLKSVTNRKEWQIDHTVDLHFQSNENGKYQYSFYVHPKEAAITLTTPKRIVSLEAKTQIGKGQNTDKASGELVFYLDKKNHANKKTSLSGWIEFSSKLLNGEAKLTHPGLSKPLQASIKTTINKADVTIETTIDVFAKPDQKIVATYKTTNEGDIKKKLQSKDTLEIKSSGLGINILTSNDVSIDRNTKTALYEQKFVYSVGSSKYTSINSWKASPSEVSVLIKVLNVEILKAVHKLKLSKEEQIVDSEISSYDNNPITSHLELKNWNTVKYSVGYKKSQNKLQFNAGLIPGQIADLRADVVKGNSKINLFYATLKLDDANFLKPDYNINSKEIEQTLKDSREHSVKFVKGASEVGKDWLNDIKKEGQNVGEVAKKAQPNLQPLKSYYVKELKEIKEEILQDQTLKQLGELIQKLLSGIVSVTSEVLEKVGNLAEQIAKAIQASFQGVLETIEKQVLPQVKTLAEKFISVATDILDSLADIVLGIVAKIGKIVEQYQPELKQVAAALGELTQDLGRFIQKAVESAKAIITEQWERISQEIQALPVVEEIKEQYKEFTKNYAETILNALREVTNTLKDAIPESFMIQKELYEILDTFTNYVEHKLKGQQINDLEVFEKIGSAILTAVKKALKAISSEDLRLPGGLVIRGDVFNFWDNLPKLVAARFSPVAYLTEEDLTKQVLELILSLVNTPRNLVPPFPLFGIIVQGQHLFTFDGKHVTFPGNCDYVLARDAVNGNFTIIATLKNGELAALTLADSKDYVTVIKGGNIKLNNEATNLPARKENLAAYRDYQMIYLRSTSGVLVSCTPDLAGCVIKISGFYHGQVRGLLGNGNNEPFDDFTLPDGKIVSEETEFGNSYKVQASCAAVTAPSHHHVEINPVCAKLFKEDDLSFCTPFVSTEIFKIACTHGLQNGQKDIESNIAKAYVAVCQNRNIPVSTPERLLKCTNGDKTYDVGDKFSVKLPSKAADIVLLVETVKGNEQTYKELLQPVVQDIGKELHSKGINDVEFHLVAYGGDNKWPSHVTVNGKLTFKGKAPNLKFGEEEKDEIEVPHELSKFEALIKAITEGIKDLKLATGLNLQSETFIEGYRYPFRAHALRSIVVLNDKPCEVGRLEVLQRLRALIFKNDQISLNLFTPVPSLEVKDGKKTKDVVGFNNDNALLLSLGKKNPKGSSDIRGDISYNDYCIDYTIKNRGNVFVTENFEGAKADGKKTFVHVAAVNIVNELTNVEQGLDCECDTVNPWSAQNECTVVYSQEKKTKGRA